MRTLFVAVAITGLLAVVTGFATSGASAATANVKVKEASKATFTAKPKPAPAPKAPGMKK